MGRNRLPTNVLELRGSFKKHPERRREEPQTQESLGDPPDYFNEAESMVWEEVKAEAMEGVLCRSDRLCIEMLVPLVIRLRERQSLKAAERVFMLNTLSRIGGTPADRSRVAAKKEEEQGDFFDALDQTA